METVTAGSTDTASEHSRRFWGRKSLRREIVIVLLIKLALIMGIKMAFFSHPLSQQETQNRLENMLAGSSQTSEPPAPPVSHSNSME